jgi:hypothetical protein
MSKSSTTGGAIGGPFNNTAQWMNVTGPTGPTFQTSAAAYQWSNNASYTVTGQSNEFSNDVFINRNGKQIPVAKTLEHIMERLCIIEPSFEKMEKYPALKEAYDNYKLIEALIKYDEDEKK